MAPRPPGAATGAVTCARCVAAVSSPSPTSPYLDEGVGLDALGILHGDAQPAGRGQAGGVVLEVHGPQKARQVPGIVQAGGQHVALAAGGRLRRERHGRSGSAAGGAQEAQRGAGKGSTAPEGAGSEIRASPEPETQAPET